MRSLFYKVKIKKVTHIDLRKETISFWESYNKYTKGTLRDWAEKLSIPVNTDGGEEMPKLYLEGRWDRIQEHCEEDIKVCQALFNRCKECNVL
jgi:hypothetical protein